MTLGDLDRRISLYSKTTTYNSYGEPVITWTLSAIVWASIGYQVVPEKFQSNQLVAPRSVQFMVRYRIVTETYKVVYDGATYDIKSIEEVGRKNYLLLNCEGADNIT